MGRKKIVDEKEENVQDNIKNRKTLIRNILHAKIKVSAKNNSQKSLIRSIKDNEITICSGKAGTGKTYVSLAYALGLLYDLDNKYNKIYLVKSVTTLKGEEIGFLKGDISDKTDPFMWSFKINMEKIIPDISMKSLFDEKIIETLPLAYARGVSLDNCIIIADEMQNVSFQNSRTLMTRIGEDSKMILLGDTNQIDLRGSVSSLESLLKMFGGVKGFGCIEMTDNNVRNPLIDVIENKFEEKAKNNG